MHYPIMLNIKEKKIVVFGGGRVALRKAKVLLRYGGEVVVVSPNILEDFKDLAGVKLIKDTYKEDYLDSALLVIAATSDPSVNREISLACKARNILANIVDDKDGSSFITSSIVDTGSLLFTISTKGKYPALSKLIRKDLESRYRVYDEEYVDLLEKIREEAIKNHSKEKENLINRALGLNLKDLREFYKELVGDL